MEITHMYRVIDIKVNQFYSNKKRQWSCWLKQEDAQAVVNTLNKNDSNRYQVKRFRLRRVKDINLRLPESQGRIYFLRDSTGLLNEPHIASVPLLGNTCWKSYKQAHKIAKIRSTVEIYSFVLMDRKKIIEDFLESDGD